MSEDISHILLTVSVSKQNETKAAATQHTSVNPVVILSNYISLS